MVLFCLTINGLKINLHIMRRVVIFGSTVNEVHMGCKALTGGLELLVREVWGNDAVIQHVSHKLISPIFYENFIAEKTLKINKLKTFFKRKNRTLVVNKSYDRWKNAFVKMFSQDVYLKLTIQNADCIIINVEGTIHHEAVLGQQMLAIGKMATELGKEVYWVNFSVEKENKDILIDALRGAKSISAREENSYNYLKGLGLNVKQSFDTALLANYSDLIKKSRFDEDDNYCLFTGSNVKKYDLVQIARTIESKGLIPVYLPMGLNDYQDLVKIKKNNIKYYELGELKYTEILSIIKNFKFVVSGRHHLNVFCILSEKPFIPLESNTWKIDGVCKMIDYDPQFDLELSKKIDIILMGGQAQFNKIRKRKVYLKNLAKLNI